MGKTPKKPKNSIMKGQQQQPAAVDMMSLYSRLNELSKEELITLKQQLIEQQKVQQKGGSQVNQIQQQQQLTNEQLRSKSKKKKKDQQMSSGMQIITSGDELAGDTSSKGNQISKQYVMAASASVENQLNNIPQQQQQIGSTKNSQGNKGGFHNSNHHIESVNIYLQASSAHKKIKKTINAQMKKKRNMDLIDVCNESTIMGKSRIIEEDQDSNSMKKIQETDNYAENEFNLIQEMQDDNAKSPFHEHQAFAISKDKEPIQPQFDEQNPSQKTAPNTEEMQNFEQQLAYQQSANTQQNENINQNYQSNTSAASNKVGNHSKQSQQQQHSKSKSNQRYDSNQTATSNQSTQYNQAFSMSQRQTSGVNIGLNRLGMLNSKKLIEQQIIGSQNNQIVGGQTTSQINVLNSVKLANGFSNSYGQKDLALSNKVSQGQQQQPKINENKYSNTVRNASGFQSKSIDSQQLLQNSRKSKIDGKLNQLKEPQSDKKRENNHNFGDSVNKFTNYQEQSKEEKEQIKEELVKIQIKTNQEELSRQNTDLQNDELEDTQYLLNYQGLQQNAQNQQNVQFAPVIQPNLLKQDSNLNDEVSPYADNIPQAPNSTKARDNFQFQQSQLGYNPQQTQPNFHQVQNSLIKKISKPLKQETLQQSIMANKKQKLDSIICLAVSVEPYLKRNMQKLGWLETTNPTQFHIRFDITDKEGSQNKLRNSQWYNHFPNNRELTTKAGLCKNLWQQCPYDYELKVEEFFPRCYDLSDQKQVDLFVLDFQQTAILSIIKIHATYFLNKTKRIQNYLQRYKDKNQFITQKVYKNNLKLECSKHDQLVSGAGSMLGNDTLRLALLYAKHHILSKQLIDRKQRSYARKFTEEEMQYMVDYSYALSQNEESIHSKFPIYEQIKTIIYHEKLQQILNQYKTIDGFSNVWVVKPSYNARGLGIYCANKLKDIIQQGKKSQSKIVQKYIENPYLVNKKKFDIRQWVLVTSWEPLDVYIFQSAYLKICGSEFNLQNLSDQYRHLSNFTVQKNNNQPSQWEDLVMSNEQFQEYLLKTNSEQFQSFTWTDTLFPKIQDVIYKTFKGVQDSQEQRTNTFEIYGIDLILDEDLNPWIIEVNLSPACNERTDFLTQMLDDMSLDLLQYLENKIIIQNNVETEWIANFKDRKEQLIKKQNQLSLSSNLNEEQFYQENNIKHRWIRVNECIQEQKQYQVSQNLMQTQQQQKGIQQPLEILGSKVNFNNEKKIDKHYLKIKSLEQIQRVYRGKKEGSVKLLKIYKTKKCQQSLIKLKQNNCAIKIQALIRMFIMKRRYQKYVKERAQLFIKRIAQTYAINKMRIVAQQLNSLKNKKASLIQNYLRKRLAQNRSFFRKLLAKRKLRRLQKIKTKRDTQRKQEIEKKFQKSNRVEKDIENYIESLFHREIQQQNKMKQILSQTPISNHKLNQPSNQVSREQLMMRSSFTSNTNLQRNYDQGNPDHMSSHTTTASQVQRIASSQNQNQQMSSQWGIEQQNRQSKQRLIPENGYEIQPSNEYEENEILATSIIHDDNNQWNTIDRVQVNSNSSTQRANSMIPFNKKVQQQNVPKPKTFAENLMNMLAMQKIGQAFSENPVESLGILKQDSRGNAGNENRNVIRRNSNVSRGGNESNNQSFINNQSIKNGKSTLENNSAITTLDNNQQKSIQFPKLNDFKSATNNIYLANRPIADPRSDTEYQYQVLESKLRKTQGGAFYQDTVLNKSSNLTTTSKSDLHNGNQQQIASTPSTDNGKFSLNPRMSSESITKGLDQKILDEYKYDNQLLMQARPRDQSHLMVVQAYKKQQHPQPQDNFKKSKKRGDSVGLPGASSKTVKKTNYQQFSEAPSAEKTRQLQFNNLGFNQQASFKKNSDNNIIGGGFIPPITDTGNRLVII
eukprot:403365167